MPKPRSHRSGNAASSTSLHVSMSYLFFCSVQVKSVSAAPHEEMMSSSLLRYDPPAGPPSGGSLRQVRATPPPVSLSTAYPDTVPTPTDERGEGQGRCPSQCGVPIRTSPHRNRTGLPAVSPPSRYSPTLGAATRTRLGGGRGAGAYFLSHAGAWSSSAAAAAAGGGPAQWRGSSASYRVQHRP